MSVLHKNVLGTAQWLERPPGKHKGPGSIPGTVETFPFLLSKLLLIFANVYIDLVAEIMKYHISVNKFMFDEKESCGEQKQVWERKRAIAPSFNLLYFTLPTMDQT